MYIDTEVSADELRPLLEKWAPWRMEIEFSNGLKATDFGTIEPFSHNPTAKIRVVENKADLEGCRGGRALDIGFNVGHNTLHLVENYDMDVVGVDVSERHKEVAEFVMGTTKNPGRARFEIADATTFRDEAGFDLVLHFGTLYHLPNPLLAVETAAANLRPGGLLALETTIYTGEDQSLSKFINGFLGDPSNWWALSRETLLQVLGIYGLVEIEVLFETEPDYLGPGLSRIILVARAPAVA